jgi:hypothetical protein
MKLHGDVPQEHRELASQLEEMETYFDGNLSAPLEMIAKGYVCLAHDWFSIGEEDEGHRLLGKADRVFPGYFTNKASDHADEDPDFARLMVNLRMLLNSLLTGNL